jgi:hypothetical protein
VWRSVHRGSALTLPTENNPLAHEGTDSRMPPYFCRMYEAFLDALQDPQWPGYLPMVITAEIRDINGFVRAIRDGLVVISAQAGPDGLYYTGSVHVRSGVEQIVRVPARDLGLDEADTLSEALWADLRELANGPTRDSLAEITPAPY